MTAHEQFRYSVTCHSDDKPVIYCLRAIAHFAEHHPQKNIAWGGTGDDDWERNEHCITLRFTHAEFRKIFRDVANDLLAGRWTETACSENNPPPQVAWQNQRVGRE
jgi:hypothetical protein